MRKSSLSGMQTVKRSIGSPWLIRYRGSGTLVPFSPGGVFFTPITPSPLPTECNGGKLLRTSPKNPNSQTFAVTLVTDKATLRGKLPVYGPEIILTGALRQELCFDEFTLRASSPEL
eukprot:sb/3476563/